ncbi:hypothetical protein ACFSCW_16270 [Sphingomonas tabacisoli]|uniref:Uncharacterized protein n=1 Tax=Sphingomonas tabacisoli TaxID=2249466 RepID=A0ABW4I5X2_9SPHN
MQPIRIAALFGLAAAMTGNAAPKASLAGVWSTPGAILTVDEGGSGRLEQDCAMGSFGPVKADAHGRFQTTGRFETYQPGPQRADDDAGAPARFEGAVEGDTLRLTVHPHGGQPQSWTLAKGKRIKLIRCY